MKRQEDLEDNLPYTNINVVDQLMETSSLH